MTEHTQPNEGWLYLALTEQDGAGVRPTLFAGKLGETEAFNSDDLKKVIETKGYKCINTVASWRMANLEPFIQSINMLNSLVLMAYRLGMGQVGNIKIAESDGSARLSRRLYDEA